MRHIDNHQIIGDDPVLDAIARVVLRHFPAAPFKVSPRDLMITASARQLLIGNTKHHLSDAKRMVFLAALRAGLDRYDVAQCLDLSDKQIKRAEAIVQERIAARPEMRTAWTSICNDLDTVAMVTQ